MPRLTPSITQLPTREKLVAGVKAVLRIGGVGRFENGGAGDGVHARDRRRVGEVRWTWALAAGARSPKLQVRMPLAIVQPAVEPAASIDQLRPAFVGRVSVTVTAVAVPAPLFVAVMT